MPTKKNLGLNDPITSTSDLVLGDIVDAVAKHLGCPHARGAIEQAVQAAIAKGAAVQSGCTVTPGVPSVLVTREGDGLGVLLSGTCGARIVGDGDPLDSITEGKPGCSPKFAVRSQWFQKVLQNGEVWTPYTNRRFLPAQYLHLMHDFQGNVSGAVARRYSLRDCWKLLDTEIEKLIWISKHWKTAFEERAQFLTVDDCVKIFREYLQALRKNVNNRGMCEFSKSKGEYWRRIQGEGRVVLWTYEKTEESGNNGSLTVTESIEPTEWLIKLNAAIEVSLKKLAKCDSYEKALAILRYDMPKTSMGTFKDQDGNVRHWLPKRWKECFLKAGAFYTLKSLIVNKHVMYTEEAGSWRSKKTFACQTAREGLTKLQALLKEDTPAFVIHAILKKSMEASGLDLGKFLRKIAKR